MGYSWFVPANGGNDFWTTDMDAATFSSFGDIQLAIAFSITEDGQQIAGYSYWYNMDLPSWTPGGFALWIPSDWNAGTVVEGSVVTSIPTPTETGWQFVELSPPIDLENGGTYALELAANGGFFWSQAYPPFSGAGIVNGPINVFSSTVGTNIGFGGTDELFNGFFGENTNVPGTAFPNSGGYNTGTPAIDVLIQASSVTDVATIAVTFKKFKLSGFSAEKSQATVAIKFKKFSVAGTSSEKSQVNAAISFKKFKLSGSSAEKSQGSAAVKFKKFSISASSVFRALFTGAIGFKKFKLAGSSAEKSQATAAVSFKKFKLSGSSAEKSQASAAVVFKKLKLSGSSAEKSQASAAVKFKKFVLAVSADAGVLVTYTSTTDGVDTYSTFSSLNNTGDSGNQDMRVLVPDSPSPDYEHAFLWLLPVEPEQGTTYGDSIATIKDLGAHNEYNLTCIQPGFPLDPWYGNNVDDPQTQQETFMLDLVDWAKSALHTTGTEKHYLIGFSKSGFGGQVLFLRNQPIFAAVASWDAACDYQTLDQYDGDSVFGEQSQLDTYELYDPNLETWKALGDTATVNRIWLGAGIDLIEATSDYSDRLTADSILHTYSFVEVDSHNWAPTPGWVAPALAAMLGGTEVVQFAGAVKFKKFSVAGTSSEKSQVNAAVKFKKIKFAGSSSEKSQASGAVKFKKLKLAAFGIEKSAASGTVVFKKIQLHGTEVHTVRSSSLFIFSQI